jgi:glycosyltransferase involved in cell wall biosynthesis
MLDVAAMQRAAGHDVALFGMQHPENPAGLLLEDFFPTHMELDPPPRGLAGGVAGAGRMVWSLASSRGMARALEAFQPDVVHCHNIYHQLSPSILAPIRRSGVRCVMTLHDYKIACPSYQMLDHGRPCDACVEGSAMQAVRRRCKGGSLTASAVLSLESSIHRALGAYDPVHLFISPSRFLAGVMVRTGIAADRVRVVNHFVESTLPQPPAGARAGFVVAGRLSHEKGIDTLIKALAHSRGDYEIHVAGDGPLRADLEALAKTVAPHRVVFHGRLDKPALQALVAGSIATVVPSRWYENQPMTILESYAAQVPVVVTNLGGMPELVRDTEDGLVVPPDDPAALAGALDRLAAAPEAAHEMGRQGRLRLAQEFDPGLHLRRLEAAYRGEPMGEDALTTGAGTHER